MISKPLANNQNNNYYCTYSMKILHSNEMILAEIPHQHIKTAPIQLVSFGELLRTSGCQIWTQYLKEREF